MARDEIGTIPIGGKLDSRDNIAKQPIGYEELPEDLKRFLADRKGKEKRSKKALEIMEGKHMLSMLLYVDSMSPVMKTDIYSSISRSGNMPDKIDDMVRLGLFKVFYTARGNSNVVTITPKGREVADIIRQMLDILEEPSDSDAVVYQVEFADEEGGGRHILMRSRVRETLFLSQNVNPGMSS